jgi:hypothetical protein
MHRIRFRTASDECPGPIDSAAAVHEALRRTTISDKPSNRDTSPYAISRCAPGWNGDSCRSGPEIYIFRRFSRWTSKFNPSIRRGDCSRMDANGLRDSPLFGLWFQIKAACYPWVMSKNLKRCKAIQRITLPDQT